MKKKALITGITGQDGSYLAEFLLEKGYEVHGIVRRVAIEDQSQRDGRIKRIKNNLKLHAGDVRDYTRMFQIIDEIKPNELYHLAAQSFVAESFEDEESVMKTNMDGTRKILNIISKINQDCKFYFAGSSEMFGKVEETPQTEKTKFHPRSPYGISKVGGFHWTRFYKEAHNLFSCSGILFNHESPRRGKEFITRKITSNVAKINRGLENTLVLGNLNAQRDWGFAGDYVEAMHSMLQQDKPDDYVISTGETHSIKEFMNVVFDYVGLNFETIDLHNLPLQECNKEIAKLKSNENGIFVVQSPKFYRPAEVDLLQGDSSKARKELGWKPKVSFYELTEMMIKEDLKNYNLF